MTRGFRNLTIRGKLIVLMLVISAAVLSLAAGSFVLIEVRSERLEVEAELSTLASIIGLNSRAALVFDDREAAAKTLDALKLKPEVVAAWLLNAENEVFAYYGRRGQLGSRLPPVGPPQQVGLGIPFRMTGDGARQYRPADGSLIIYHPVRLDGDHVGVLVLQAGLSELKARTAAMVTAMTGILLLSGLFACLLASWLQRFVSRPIAELTGVMARVSDEKDYGLRLGSRSGDEIGLLISGFNAMLAEVEQRDRQLEEANLLLEQRVKDRTEALDRANRELLEEVGERRRAEDQLRTKDKALASAINAMAIGDAQGRLRYVNQAFLNLWGYDSEQEVLGHPTEGLWQEPGAARAATEHLLRAGTWSGELVGVRKDGVLMDVQVTASLVADEAGRPLNLMASFIDVTERKRAEKALRESEERFRQMVDLLPQPIFEADAAGRLTFANRAGLEAFGYLPEDLARGLTVLEAVVPDERQEALPNLHRVLLGEQIGPIERTMLRRDGSTFPALIHAGPILRGPEPTGMRGLIIDISERRQAEEAMRMLGKALETTRVGVTISNLRGEIVFTNPAEAGMHGYQIEELLGQKVNVLGPLELRSEFPGAKVQTGQRETLNVRRDGSLFPVRLVSDLVVDAAGSPLAVVTVCEDITERKETEARLKASLAEKDVLLKEIHHRVKNNLQIISSLLNLQLLKITEAKTRAELNATRNRIRSMALIHAKLYQSENLSKINFAEYIEEFSRQLRSLHDVSPKKVRLVLDIDAVYLDVDVAIPCGMMVNELLTNALKYAFPEGRSGEIRVRLRSEAAGTVLSVEDDGIGLPPEIDLESVETLGLQLVRGLAQQVNGTVAVERSAGTRVVIRCPAARSDMEGHG